MSLYNKRLEAGKVIWPVSQSDFAAPVSTAQLGYLLIMGWPALPRTSSMMSFS